jgi:hypothetical protein
MTGMHEAIAGALAAAGHEVDPDVVWIAAQAAEAHAQRVADQTFAALTQQVTT